MADIRPNQLPDAVAFSGTDKIIVDQNVNGVRKAEPAPFIDFVAPIASQSEAETGTDNTKRMTPLRTAQYVAGQVGVTIASVTQGSKADSAVQNVNGKMGPDVIIDKSDVGLGDADNTSDMAKPVSAATQAALDGKVNTTSPRLIPSGGDTGQVLVKSSDDDYDLKWETVAAATAVSYAPQTLADAQKGQARANIDAGILAGFRNKIINGDFEIAQRGTSQTNNGYGSVDRWLSGNIGSTKTASQQAFVPGQTDVPGNPKFFHRTVVASVAGAANLCNLVYRSEDVTELSGELSTLTFYAKADANKSMAIEFAQVFGSGGSPEEESNRQKLSLTTSWQRFSLLVNLPSIAGKTLAAGHYNSIRFWFDAGSNWNDNTLSLGQQSGTFDIAHVSWVKGDATAEADPFSPRHIQQELALCQRYYQNIRARLWGPQVSAFFGTTISLLGGMRTDPSVTLKNIISTGGSNVRVEDARSTQFNFLISGDSSAGIYANADIDIDAEL